MPYRLRPGSARPANGVESVCAVGRKPGGGRTIESPWLIQTGCSRSMPAKSPSASVNVTVAGPYSRLLDGSDLAAQLVGHELQPVADAEHRDAPGPERRIGARRVGVVDR